MSDVVANRAASAVETSGSSADGNGIEVIGVIDEQIHDRSVFRRVLGLGTVSPEALRDNLRSFVERIETAVGGLPDTVAGYEVGELTVAVTVTTKGQLMLLGSGGELSGQGGLTLKLTRKRPATSHSPQEG